MDATDAKQNKFVDAARNDRPTHVASPALDTEHKNKKLLEDYAEEFLRKYLEWGIRQLC